MNKKFLVILYALTFLGIYTGVYALNLSRVKTWSAEVLTHTDLNAEFDNILNHTISNTDIASDAAILGSKLDLSVPGVIGGTTPAAGSFTTLSTSGAITIGDAAADTVLFNANTIEFEGATANAYENVFAMPDPTAADNAFTFPQLSGTVVLTTGAEADIDIGTYELRANTLESDVATGTAPFTIASTTVSTNLNADLLDGSHASTTTGSAVIPIADASGYLPDNSVDTAAIKTTVAEASVGTNVWTKIILTGGTYVFMPQFKTTSLSGSYSSAFMVSDVAATFPTTSYATFISAYSTSSDIYVQWRYVTASGTDKWIFLLVDKITKEIKASYSSDDHPAYCNGGDYNKLSHPFTSYDNSTQDIILLDKDTCATLKDESELTKKSILELINNEYKVDFTKELVYQPLHSGKYIDDSGKRVKELVRSIPDYIKVRELIKLTNEEKQQKETKNKQAIQKVEQDKNKKEQDKIKAMDKLEAIGLTTNEIEALIRN